MGKQRIEYIDAMRGFTMILVVYSHIIHYSFDMLYATSFNNLFLFFRMPLFFFISGFVCFKSLGFWTCNNIRQFIRRKVRQQLLPTAFFAVAYLWIFRFTWNDWVADCSKLGYWFTLMLFVYFAIHAIIHLCCQRLDEKRHGQEKLFGVMFAISIILSWIAYSAPISNEWTTKLSIPHLRYYLYFCLGQMAHCYMSRFESWLENKWFMAIVTPSLFLCFFGGDTFKVLKLLTPILGIVLVFAFFRHYKDSFTQDTKTGKTLQYIGRRTLDIYLIHYFFLPYNLQMVGDWFRANPNPVIEFFTCTALAVMVMCCCFVVSALFRMNPLLRWLVLGQKR